MVKCFSITLAPAATAHQGARLCEYALVNTGDFTLGKAVSEFETLFAEACKAPFAIGVGSGTDALILSLKALGIGPGDEVITATNTFIATVGAIAMTGARPVLVDNEDGFVIDHTKFKGCLLSN